MIPNLSKYFPFCLLFCGDFGSNFSGMEDRSIRHLWIHSIHQIRFPVLLFFIYFLLIWGGIVGFFLLGRIIVLFINYNLRSNSKKFKPEDMEGRLEGKNCIVTGANSGIGFGAAEGLAARWCFTLLLDCSHSVIIFHLYLILLCSSEGPQFTWSVVIKKEGKKLFPRFRRLLETLMYFLRYVLPIKQNSM